MENSGIYIIRFKNRYRVIYIPNVENLNWSFMTFATEKTFIPTRLVEWFKNSKDYSGYGAAINNALEIKKRCGADIHVVNYGKTWEQTLIEAREIAKDELAAIAKVNDGRWDDAVEILLHMED